MKPAVNGWMMGWGRLDATAHPQRKVERRIGECVVAEAGDDFRLVNEPGSKAVICKRREGRGQGGVRMWRKWEVVT